MKKNAKCQLGRFCQEPFNYCLAYTSNLLVYLIKNKFLYHSVHVHVLGVGLVYIV